MSCRHLFTAKFTEMTFIFLHMEEYKENTIYTLIKVVAGIITFISWPHHSEHISALLVKGHFYFHGHAPFCMLFTTYISDITPSSVETIMRGGLIVQTGSGLISGRIASSQTDTIGPRGTHYDSILLYIKHVLAIRGVPIIRSAIISTTNMVIFTNIGICTEQQEDRYCYRYLYSSNSLYINGLCIGFLRYSCGSLVPVAYCSL